MKKLGTKTINFWMYICTIWKAICPFLGFAYLMGWLTMVFEDPVFEIINNIIGWFPNLIDTICPRKVDIFGGEHLLGYIYAAALTIISMYFAMKFNIYLNDCKMQNENYVKKIEVKKTDNAINKSSKVKDDSYRYTHFFGLLELNLEYVGAIYKPESEMLKLRNEYLKMLVNKLSEKYSNVKFKVTDKVFMVSDEFLIFDPFLLDISKLHKIFVELDNQKSIKTELLLSFSCGNEKNNTAVIEKILEKVNNLKYSNKVIAINEFYKKYEAIKANHFNFTSLGLSRIELYENKEVDVDLYYLKKN